MKRPLLHIVTLLVLPFVISLPVSAAENSARERVQGLLEDFQQTYGFPGATVAFSLADGHIETLAIGLADVEAGVPMTTESRMLAASIGKMIWGALALSLESEGALSRADLVSDHLGHLPWFDRLPNADTMTVGQLLTHSAGLPDHVHMEDVAASLIALGLRTPFEPDEIIAFILDEPPLFEAGSAWAYTDTGYLLLGLVIEAATGEDVFDLARKRFLIPLDLTRTNPSNAPGIEGLAVGYTEESNPFGLPPRTMDESGSLAWNPAIEWTGGGFASTSADLAKWGQALFNGEAMESEYLDRLLDGVPVHPDAPGIIYGSGVAIYQDTPHGPVFGHGGWIPGYVSSVRHYADHDLTIAFQINSDVGVLDDATDLVSALEIALAEALIGSATQ
ncbi:beta-lactamase family protein [Aliiroseovarius sp. S1123]|uniref:serine hydrolase domain-containing protein n=1 Tax=unclassified Aliiroseovarius TaxID=2623558 RepID=UPI001FF6C749|nr:beta-lactamase family protein [Aliiroseovarius sp. S1123]